MWCCSSSVSFTSGSTICEERVSSRDCGHLEAAVVDFDVFEQWEKGFDCVFTLLPNFMNLWLFMSKPITNFTIVFFEALIELSQQSCVDILEQFFSLIFAILSEILFKFSTEVNTLWVSCCEAMLHYLLTIVKYSHHLFSKWLIDIFPKCLVQFIDRLVDDVINNILSCF